MESQPGPVRSLHPSADIAAHHEVVDPGPRPIVRAVLGLAVGALAGAVMVRLTPADPLPVPLPQRGP